MRTHASARAGSLGTFRRARRASRSSLGSVAFTDPSVQWRHGDGPNETMAYSGGHVLAFLLDVELLRRGHAAGLGAMIADLVHRHDPGCSAQDLKAWLTAHDAEDLYHSYIAGTAVPDVPALLLQIGAREDPLPTQLAYLGVRTDPERSGIPFRPITIVELDPDGPAAAAGAAVGDVITGWWPARTEEVTPGPEVSTRFLFGLTQLSPGYEGSYFGVRRECKDIQISVVPRVIDGGYLTSFASTPALDAFFDRPSTRIPSCLHEACPDTHRRGS